MSKLINLTGMKFGKLTVVRRGDSHTTASGQRVTMWECKCECGNSLVVSASNLRTGHSKSCGCGNLARHYVHGDCADGKVDRLYSIWSQMVRRCYDERCDKYSLYGARGISVCDEWKDDYVAFREWANLNGYEKRLSIDRIDVNGNYTPANCRWATQKTQSNNTRRNVFIEYNGEKKTLSEWAEFAGIPYKTFYYRMRKGWEIDRAINTPLRIGGEKN